MKPLLRALDWVSRPAWFEPDGMANNRLNSSSFSIRLATPSTCCVSNLILCEFSAVVLSLQQVVWLARAAEEGAEVMLHPLAPCSRAQTTCLLTRSRSSVQAGPATLRGTSE